MEAVEVDGRVIDISILNDVELHCAVLVGGQVTTYSELLDSPLHRWALQYIVYDELHDVSTIYLKDTSW